MKHFFSFLLSATVFITGNAVNAQTTNITGPAGSGNFGRTVTVLTNGNYVVTDPFYDDGAVVDVGAVYLYNGSTHALISTLKGSNTNDYVGNGGITVLSNGNYVVTSYSWKNGAATFAGAVTFCNAGSGISGVVSSSNSLVGSTTNDQVGNGGVTALSNNNYVVRSTNWANGAATGAGAVTFGSGAAGISGVVSSSNSLVGSTINDNVGNNGVTPLNNGNYVVRSANWDNGTAYDAGAVTFGSGTTGISGIVSSSNSLVGSSAGDNVGNYGIRALTNENYVVISPFWDNGAVTDVGAITFSSGTTGISGIVSSSNSLVGSTINDNIGNGGVTALSNGNYAISSFFWDNGAVTNAGAVTFSSGTTGISGIVSSSNSLVGTTANDKVGYGGVRALSNGNYIVSSSSWNNGAVFAVGAVTFSSGTIGVIGPVSASNSLVGSTASDQVGSNGLTALSNGNYVVGSSNWDNGAVTDAGAITFGSGTAGVIGIVSAANSLVGSTFNDKVGANGGIALSNGNYVVINVNWDNGAATDAGAVTFGIGTIGVSGTVSASNSLVGSTLNDNVGNYGVIAFTNGNYVVISANWDNGAITNAGAITFGSGTAGAIGILSATNSLVGSTLNDNVGNNGVTPLSNGNYVVRSANWDNGAITNAGAISIGNGSVGVFGVITSCNSVLGTTASGGGNMVFAYNYTYNYLIVGRPSDNIVTIYNPSGMPLANTLDATTVNINGNNAVPLIANSGCRIIATLTPNGASQVNGTVNAKAWIEPSVPTFSGKPFVARHYEITPTTNPSNATAKVTLYFTQQEFTDFNAHAASSLDLPTGPADAIGIANLRIGKYPGTSSNGSGLPGTYSGTASVIDPVDADIVWNNSLSRWEVSFNVTGFSGFVVQTYASPLPLKLLSFNGRLQNNNGVLNWKTTNELNAHSFDIERSIDGRNYMKVGNVAAFNTAGDHQYNFTDNNIDLLSAPVVYYRLKQKDIDGRFTYSSIVALSIDDSKSIVLFYPNPVTTEANLTITVNKKQQVTGRIIDNAGRVVKQMLWNITAGSTALPVDVKELAKGMYYLELKGEIINERKVFVKQ